MGLVLGDGDCLLWGDGDGPLRTGGGLEEVCGARGRGEGECRLFGWGDRASRIDRLGEDPFLCFDDNEGERLLVAGELLCLGGGEWETRRFGGGVGDALRLGGGGGEAVLLFGGGEGEYLLCIGGEYLLGDGERRRGGGEGVLRRGGGVGDLRRRGGGAGEGERRLLVGGGEGLLLRLPLLVIGDCHRFPICIRGEASFWRFRGDGEALREGECLRRRPTSPFFTWDLLGRSSSEEEEEPESDEDCWFCRLYWRLCCTESAAAVLPPLSSSDSDNSTFLGLGAGDGDSLFSVPLCFVTLPEVLPGETETRLFLVRFDCWGVGEWRVFGGGVAGGDGLCLRLGGLAEGDNLRVFRGGLDVLLGGFFGGDRERDEEDDELLPDKDADERRLRLTGDLLLLCLGGGGIRLGGVLLRGDGRLLGLGRLLGEYDRDLVLWRRLGRV